MTQPLFLVDAEQAEADELAALGVHLEQPMAAAETDAVASVLLRRMGEIHTDIARFLQARELEKIAIDARYERLVQPLERRLEQCENAVTALALRADFGPKKRSRDVGFGTYGVRKLPAKLEVVDGGALEAWAAIRAPELVRCRIEIPLLELIAKLPEYVGGAKYDVLKKPLTEYYKTTGDLPAGCIETPEQDVPFAKPASPLAAEK